jgi:hypothetical protein
MNFCQINKSTNSTLRKKTFSALKVVFFLFGCFGSLAVQAATDLNEGDIVFIGYNSMSNNGTNVNNPNYFAFITRKPIEIGTVIYFTNQEWNGSGFDAPASGKKQGTIKLVFNESISLGQPVEIIYSVNTAGYLKSTKGIVSYESGNTFDFDPTPINRVKEIYVYQTSPNTSYISGLVWDNAIPSSYPTGLDFSNTSSKNAAITGFNGNSAKCGIWAPSSVSAPIYFNQTLDVSFYDNISGNWKFVSSNALNGGYCPCNPDSVHANITAALYSIIESNLTFDKYRYDSKGNWAQYDGTNWTPLLTPNGTPDWGLNTRSKEVILHKSLVLEINTSAFNYDVFECAKLTIEDTIGQDGVTITLKPGNVLFIYNAIDFIDCNISNSDPLLGTGNKPKLKFKSGSSGTDNYYALLGSTIANMNDLDGDFQYEYLIQNPGWHHLQSPISSQFNSIGVTPQTGATSTFSFGSGNFYYWDATNSQWIQGTATENFSAKPYTILLATTEVPCVLTVTGPLSNPDQDVVANLSADYHNPGVSTTTAYGNVPGWAGDGSAGWNFYGNPYLTAISTEDLFINFHNSSSNSNKMQGLDNKLFIWQPGSVVSNLTSDYKYKTYLGGVHGGSAQAQYLPPFQAFFMRNSSGASSAKGFVKSKKYSSTSALNASNSITNKTQSAEQQKTLILEKVSNGEYGTVYVVPFGKNRMIHSVADILSSPVKETAFCLAHDSLIFDLKYWPIPDEDTSSIPVLVSHPTPGETFKLSSSDPNTFLLDKALNVLHSFHQGDYTFTHQTAYNASPRFTWIFAGNATVGLEEELWQSDPVVISYGESWIKFSYSDDVDFTLVDMQGKALYSGRIQNGEYTLETASMPSGIYTILSNAFSSKFLVR